MVLRLIVGVILWIGISACGLTSTVVMSRMVDEVNQRLPKEERFAVLGWYPFKASRLFAEYDRLYPGSNRRRQLRYLFILGIALLAGAVFLLKPLMGGLPLK